jgi:membrane protease YdiL (CAAX protease family)
MLSGMMWKPEAVVRLILAVLICVFVSALLAAIVRRFTGASFDDSPWRAVVGVLCFQGLALVLIRRFLHEHQTGWADAFGFRNRLWRAVLLGAAVSLLFLPIGMSLQWATAELMNHFSVRPDEQQAVRALRQMRGWVEYAALGGLTIVVVPIAEESLFRGILYPAVKQLGFPRLALWGTSVLFAAIHFNLPIFLPLLALAIALTLLYERTGNLLASISAHALFNAVNFAALILSDKFNHLPP